MLYLSLYYILYIHTLLRVILGYNIGNWKQTKKVTARNEKEATEADLKAAKMQVEAADAAEETKKRLDKTM